MTVYRCRMPYCEGECFDPRGVCDDCFLHRADQLRAMPHLYAGAYTHLVPSARRSNPEHITLPSPGGTVPLSMTVYDAMEYAAQVIGSWAHIARPGKDHSDVKSWSGAVFVANVKLLIRSDSRIVSGYLCGDYINDVHCVHRRLVQIAFPCETRRLVAPCIHCDSVSIVSRNADEYAVCLTCGARWSHARLLMLEQHAYQAAS